jgi:hypothetical protein
MQKSLAIPFKPLTGKLLWLSIFVLAGMAVLIFPALHLSEAKLFPGLVYFIMLVSLLFALYGAGGRSSAMETTDIWRRLASWLGLAFLVHLVLYAAVLGYIGFAYRNISLEGLQVTFIYTLLCWCIPFFYSAIMGYVIYSWLPCYYGYCLIVAVWFLTMPYNSILGLVPKKVAGWLVNGDPNISEVFSSQLLEGIEVNNGYYAQRMFMFLILISLYLMASYRRSLQINGAAAVLLIIAMTIPLVSPFVPYIEGKDEPQLAVFRLPAGTDEVQSDYTISKYVLHIRHGRSNHDLRYTVDMNIVSTSNRIQMALLNDFQIRSARLDQTPIIAEQRDQLVMLDLPEKQGVLHMEIETRSYHPVGPTTAQLVATSPWYPMNPLEAENPYEKATKEQYDIYWSSPAPNEIRSNLKQKSNLYWSGEAYGPTLLMGRFKEKRKVVYPHYKTVGQASGIKQRIESFVYDRNAKYRASVKLPSNLYYVSAFRGVQANPDEAYISAEANSYEDIERIFYRKIDPSKQKP